MTTSIHEEPIGTLADYGRVPIAFTVERRVRVVDGELVEEPVASSWTKDYDREAEGGPERWATRFDVSRWGLLVAREGDRRIGGAVVAWGTKGVQMLEGRDDLAVLWDLRVEPSRRQRGVGTALFDRAAAWARERGCVRLDVETQDINVPACRFYASRGCALRKVQPGAYPGLPDETLLLWSLVLG